LLLDKDIPPMNPVIALSLTGIASPMHAATGGGVFEGAERRNGVIGSM
jgi:hypothetical protein